MYAQKVVEGGGPKQHLLLLIELLKKEDDPALRHHIKQLKKAWRVRRPCLPKKTRAA